MSYTYDHRKRPQGPQNAEPEPAGASIPNYQALLNGTARPTAEQKGRPFDLDAAMKAKMENAFGDLSGVKFYESQAVGQAGAEAIAQGNEIAFAPGKADFSTRSGQERLGHELSHVMSQRSGQVRGSGFLNNAALEARADREGAMAAAGQQVYAGPVTHAISDASPSPFAAGSMQAKRGDEEKKSLQPDLIGEKPHWGDVKWGMFTNMAHGIKHRKKLDLSSKRDDILKREATDMAMTDEDALDDSVYIPDPEGDDEEGYNYVDDPTVEDPQLYDDRLENGRLDEILSLANADEDEEFDPNQTIIGESAGKDFSQNPLPMQEPEPKKKKKWWQFWK